MTRLLAEENRHIGRNSPCCGVWEQDNRRSLWLRDACEDVVVFTELITLRLFSFHTQDQVRKHFHCQYCVARKKIGAIFNI